MLLKIFKHNSLCLLNMEGNTSIKSVIDRLSTAGYEFTFAISKLIYHNIFQDI